MSERQDYIALEWVAGEIEETLKQAAEALEGYIANRDDNAKLRFCLTHIHQVHGTLQMVNFVGAAFLAAEMESLVQSLRQEAVHSSHVDDALSVLQKAILHLPLYLEHVKLSRHSLPATLLPIVNDIRAVRGGRLISETLLFAPDFSSLRDLDASELKVSGPELTEVAQKLRQMFQVALLGVIREKDVKANLNYLAKVCARLVKLSEGFPLQALWQVCIAVLEGLLNGSISPSVAVKMLLRQVDRQVGFIVEHGDSALRQPPPQELIKNLLYYVARSDSNSRFITTVKQDFNLHQSLLGEDELLESAAVTQDHQVLVSVSRALVAELRSIQTTVESLINEAESLPDLLNSLEAMTDVLSVLSMGEALTVVQDVITQLKEVSQTGAIESATLQAIETQIVALTESLTPDELDEIPQETVLFNDSEEAQEQLDRAFESIVRESRNGLEQAREAIIEFVATQWDHSCLVDLPDLLKGVSGSLNIVPLTRAANVLSACESYVSEVLLAQGGIPDWQKLDTLADAITSVDYYLERMDEGDVEEENSILDIAEESVAELGFAIDGKSDNRQAQLSEEVQDPEHVDADLISEHTVTSDQPERDSQPHLAEVIPFQAAMNTGEDSTEELSSQSETLESESAPVVESSSQAVTESIDDEIDPEILEIFVEEASEVLETIDEYLPKWQSDLADNDAGSTVRRAFHTLKGSGRMVGAEDIGELAWSIENMLNRVMEGSMVMDQARFDLVGEARNEVPGFVQAFERGEKITSDRAKAIIDRAVLLAKEQSPAIVEETEALIEAAGESSDENIESYDNFEIVAEPENSTIEEKHITSESVDLVNELARESETEDDALDSELLEIFAAEAMVHGQVLDDFIDHCHQLAGPAEFSDELQRALHTLKGSANMAGIVPVATVVTPLERTVKEMRSSQLKTDDEMLALLERGSLYIKAGIEQLATSPLQAFSDSDEYSAQLSELLNRRIAAIDEVEEEDGGIGPEALNEFLTNSLDLITEVSGKLVLWQQGEYGRSELGQFEELMDKYIEAAEAVNISSSAQFGQALQALYRRGAALEIGIPNSRFFALANDGNDCLIDMLDQIAGQQTPAFDEQLYAKIQNHEIVADAESSAVAVQSFDSSIVEPQHAEQESSNADNTIGDDVSEDISDKFEFDETNFEVDESEVSDHESDILNAIVSEVGVPDIDGMDFDGDDIADEMLDALADVEEQSVDVDDAEIAAAMSSFAEAVSSDLEGNEASGDAIPHSAEITPVVDDESVLELASINVSAEAKNVQDEDDDLENEIIEIFLEEADDLLDNIDDVIAAWSEDRSNREYLDDLLRILHTLKGGARLAGLTSLGDLSHDFETSLAVLERSQDDVDDATLDLAQRYQDQLISQVAAVKAGGEKDEEQTIDSSVIDSSVIDLVSSVPVANEAASEQTIETEEIEVSAEFSEDDFESVDEDAATIYLETEDADVLEVDYIDDVDEELLDSIVELVDDSAGTEEIEPSTDSEESVLAPVVALKPRAVSAEEIASPLIDPAAKKAPQEMVKVSSQLLEELVNLAGETSISRGRAEEQISELVFSLDEMQITVDRLQEQVRRLDMETEQQILYRQEQVEIEGLEGFDPLEMDRYSQLQQLSRSLLESSSDLVDIKSTLADKSRDMETLLVQQSRINTDLQEGLMRSRMVPFSRMVPRLRRIIRQVSSELDKKVDFHLDNVEGELDRTVLEKMVAPLEHMLRNAVDHGIESGNEREASGKSRRGNISLDLSREGGEIVLRLSDDGAGIDLLAVREKAIERGLMERDADLSDSEILQFILQSGFSTATAVTQISGRGVGMDVVHSEIKQLGGSMDIASVRGKGSTFTVRLPFTVSVNRALMVNVGGDSYAIPLNTIEGIVRVSPFELEAYYQPDAPMFEYAGQPYVLRYMGSLLNRGETPNLDGQTTPLPVVLVRGAEHSVAVQVDSLMGSREIVVKPLGPQFSMVQGLSGATVLGDGNVVVILDLLALIRADASHLYKDISSQKSATPVEDNNLLVMVIDDSVTVRKVTSRFLERQGMEVVLAKDGADAIAQLQEMDQVPDIMLLDIEMPRMDGFEVASRVKHNPRLQDIPIIMITSRTGEKHRERALSLGVNEYMGKPYQESTLLETINTLTTVTAN